MRKKLLCGMLALLMLFAAVAPALAAETDVYAAGKTAYVSKMEIFLDGEQVYPSGYLISTGAVSYTHLDVYKRQLPQHPPLYRLPIH